MQRFLFSVDYLSDLPPHIFGCRGYLRLMGEDEAGTFARLKIHCRELIDPKTAEHHRRIVKTTGDSFNIATYLEGIAEAGGISVSEDALRWLAGAGGLTRI